ncbi:prolyl oligopeptidase family serine peptidase [Arenimonas sp.]|uniref:S9 family peptidase n=1 Tax=Arenimonas sp. TaxID=1872635 RepID=UPI0039E5985C
MNLRHAFLPVLMAALLPAGAQAARPLEVRDMAALDRVSSPVLSPDGRLVVFAVRQTDLDANKSRTGLWIENLVARDAAPPVRFTAEGMSVNSPAFSPDGKTVYFLSAKSGSMQLWSQAVAGGDAVQLSNYTMDVGGYKLSPDGKSIALAFEVFNDCDTLDCSKKRVDEAAARKARGVVFDKAFIRHWDTWADGRRNQLFVASFGADGKLGGEPVKLSRGIDGDIPSKPFGDVDEFAWSPDGKSIAFSVRIAGKTEPWSTNFDIFLAPVEGDAAPKNLTAANPAWDAGPVFSADGKTLFYRAMKRPGFEADRFALMSLDLGSGASRELDPLWDASADNIKLSADGKRIYTTAQELGQHPLFSFDIAAGQATRVAGDGSIATFDLVGDTLVFVRNSLKSPGDLFASRADGSAARQVSVNNVEKFKDIAFGQYEQFNFIGWNGETVHGYVVKPWNYQAGKKYPVAFLIHGGPQGSFGNGWSFRWNPQTYAGQGFAVVMIDFHGSTGYGQAFTDAISQHWGDRPLEDLQKGWAAAQKKYAFLDGNRACALGASYGGFMVNWIASQWPDAWKCLVSHDGIFDNRMMGYSTEEMWFTEWENGGTVFDKPESYERFNPVLHADKFKVPMLVVHGQLDYRIPVEQGIALFGALQRKGVESQFLYFPNENHWVLNPQNSVLWHDTVNAWIKRWTAE